MSDLGIRKSDVQDVLVKMERVLFSAEEDHDWGIPRRITRVFAAAYVNNYYPPESIILIKAYKLLQNIGVYYNVDTDQDREQKIQFEIENNS